MGFEFCYFLLVVSILVPEYEAKTIPIQNRNTNRISVAWKDDNRLDKVVSGENFEEENNEEKFNSIDAFNEKFKRKKSSPKPSIVDTIYPDRPDLLLLTFPSEYISQERGKLLNIVEKKYSHLIDADVLRKVADGNTEAMPDIWSFLSTFDVKGAFTSLLAQQFVENYTNANERPAVSDISHEECKELCRDKETKLMQFINGALIRITQTEEEGEDIRIRIRPNYRKNFKYKTTEDNHSTCTCINTSKNIYVSPQLKEIIHQKFFNSNEGEKEIEDLLTQTNTADAEDGNLADVHKDENSGWSFSKLGNVVLYHIGYGSEKTRRREPKRYDRYYAASKAEWILLNAVANILILGFCFPLWPFHVVFFLIGYFFV